MWWVIGGAGFIGTNLARRLLNNGDDLIVADNLSRPGVEANLDWLRGCGPFKFAKVDIKRTDAVADLLRDVGDGDVVVHLAGQTAVTTSIKNPREDFETNAVGTLNLLEALRASQRRPLFMYASTNKVYGGLDTTTIDEQATRYVCRDYPMGVPETAPLDFYSPYGCSKGAADQYARDYARIFGLPTVVFRQSCIYGPRQFGMVGQGWLAWFMIAALRGRDITIYGTGKQVRDVLYIEDLVDAYLLAAANKETVAGNIYNVGGGPERTISVWAEFGPILEELLGRPVPVGYDAARPGDQPVYISDVRKIARDLGWRPKTTVRDGLRKLFQWVCSNEDLFQL